MQIYKPNTQNLKVLTPSGYQSFKGISYMGIKPILRLELDNNIWIECTDDHKIYINENQKVPAKDLKIGDNIITEKGSIFLQKTYYTGRKEDVYDLVGVDAGNKFYGNKILVSNCEFIIYDETLINPLILVGLKGNEPILRTGQVRWYKKPEKGGIYLVGLDPSLGTGGDNAAIEVFEGATMTQIAEWQHNKSPVKIQMKILQDILEYIAKETNYKEKVHAETEIYWSVENNTIGEAALTVLDYTGEENFMGEMIHQPRSKGATRKHRKGFTTTAKTKIAMCSMLKNLIETNKMEIYSKNLIRELKNYIAQGLKFQAKIGETDDLVSALLLVLRISHYLAKYDDKVYQRMMQSTSDEDVNFEQILPFGLI